MHIQRVAPIILILVMLFSLSCCGSINKDMLGDDNNIEIEEKQVVEEKPSIDLDDENKEEDIDIKEDLFEDPPFVQLLKSGVYYYEYMDAHVIHGEGSHTGYVAQTTDKSCTYTYSDDDLNYREILDIVANRWYMVRDYAKKYMEKDEPEITFTDYNDFVVTEVGKEELLGELLDYIDYRMPGDNPAPTFSFTKVKPDGFRIYLKDGDAYAIRDYIFVLQNSFSYISNISNTPSLECFTIPEGYEQEPLSGFFGGTGDRV